MLNRITIKSRRNRKGFTLIELLVVVLILAILMAVALPLYLSAVADSQRKTCRANMQTIANAVQSARVKAVETNYANEISTNTAALVITGAAPGTLADLQSIPSCPSGGTYTISDTGTLPANTTYQVNCSGTSGGVPHGKFQPGTDSQ